MAESVRSSYQRRTRRAPTVIMEPDRANYNAFAPNYAGYLQQTAQTQEPGTSAGLAAFNAAALRNETMNEREAYAAMLKRAQEMQTSESAADRALEVELAHIGQQPEMAKLGGLGIWNEQGPGTGGSWITPRYGPGASIVNAESLSGRRAERRAVDVAADVNQSQLGYFTSPEAAAARDAPVIQGTHIDPETGMEVPNAPLAAPEKPFVTALTPEQERKNYETSQGLTAKQQIEIATLKGAAKDGSGDVEVEITRNEDGTVADVKLKGDPEALNRRGINPSTGLGTVQVNPKAGAQGGGASATPAATAPVKASAKPIVKPGSLVDYRDPGYDRIEARLEEKYKGRLPPGLLRRIRVFGERSNANAVSKKGAQSVYQIMPETRDLFQAKHKIDAYAGPAEAAEIAALHLIGSIERGQDPVMEYNAGPKSRGAWNSLETRAYAKRVNSPEAHRLVAANPEEVYAARFRTLDSVADAKVVGNTTVVTMKNGTVRTFSGGRPMKGK